MNYIENDEWINIEWIWYVFIYFRYEYYIMYIHNYNEYIMILKYLELQ